MPLGLSPRWPCSRQCAVAAPAYLLLPLDTQVLGDSPSNPEFQTHSSLPLHVVATLALRADQGGHSSVSPAGESQRACSVV